MNALAQRKPTITARRVGETLEDVMARLNGYAAETANRRGDHKQWLLSQPQSLRCDRHGIERLIDPEEAFKACRYDSEPFAVVYQPCPQCLAQVQDDEQLAVWAKRGVPAKLIGATLDQLTYTTESGRKNLELCRKFQVKPKGFLILMGPVGNGKSHIAAAILQTFGKGRFISQADLLEKHRATYRDDHAEDIGKRCKETPLLVLEEVGLSVGGKDEGPLIHGIIDARYSAKLPTIIISNLLPKEFNEQLGERIVDRMREAIFARCAFDEPSRRAEQRERYLEL